MERKRGKKRLSEWEFSSYQKGPISPFKWECVSNWTCQHTITSVAEQDRTEGCSPTKWKIFANNRGKYQESCLVLRSRPPTFLSLSCPRPPQWGIWSDPQLSNQKIRRHIVHLSLPHPQVSQRPPWSLCLLNTLRIIYLSLLALLLPEAGGPSSLMDTSTAAPHCLLCFQFCTCDSVDTVDQKSHSIKQIRSCHTPCLKLCDLQAKVQIIFKNLHSIGAGEENSQNLPYVSAGIKKGSQHNYSP